MAKITKPLLFSAHFHIDEIKLHDAGLIDPFLNVDTQLFIDPVLLKKSRFEEISKNGYTHFCHHFPTMYDF
ncbi:hypothetical protein WJ038_02975 [Vibrio parahaemolyticus]|uniref:hypothetical protein n=1 Tax=Vibrio parahaemolyticus TaxID=670 RepID=UPI00040F7AED|nr:hypothetical protein [Vibrio parahaemolyticus]KKI07773.1 hypothetical protein WU75_19430 [Vibrio parahaemolyticus]MBY7690593.1 hypothetical protein [Vibrio parahaemolyticus]OOE25953.1 hypothetical protein BS100_20430 [Vibrio parahaemolyticus]UJX01182.1 hypothetical protein JHT10_11120 [Vibrio parahaemolyticus]UJX13870.1 hypothetical protein JHT21_02985 [Vibrio parahaemolyticus]